MIAKNGARDVRLCVSVNGTDVTGKDGIEVSGGGAYPRCMIIDQPELLKVTFDAKLLKNGQNQISLSLNGSTGDLGAYANMIYDAIRLDVDGTSSVKTGVSIGGEIEKMTRVEMMKKTIRSKRQKQAITADDRDAIQELKEAALKDEFDILLVFMFDRIGRIDDETPFVVEWFAKHGIQVWSVMEGQQRFDSHVDKLMNYLRFWQASGESEKTSMRIKSKMQQMIEDGLYTGGPVKYGYHLIDSGLVNRKGIPIKKYAVDAVESEVLHMIDDMTIHKGYGSHRLSRYLNENGYKTHTGGKFTSTIVNRILKDRFYCGYLDDGTSTEALQALRIRSDETYVQILEILEQRNNANEEKRHIALQTKG